MSGNEKEAPQAAQLQRPFGFLPLGTATPWGTVEGVSIATDGERYYWLVKDGDVALMPAATVEAE